MQQINPFLINKTANVLVKSDGGLKETKFKSKKKRGDCVVRNHLVCVSDGKIYDTWDSKYRCANSYFTKQRSQKQ